MNTEIRADGRPRRLRLRTPFFSLSSFYDYALYGSFDANRPDPRMGPFETTGTFEAENWATIPAYLWRVTAGSFRTVYRWTIVSIEGRVHYTEMQSRRLDWENDAH